MSATADELRVVVAEAIEAQLGDEIDEGELPRDLAVHRTADRLVREALAAGHSGDASVSEVTAFGAGNTAMVVARVSAHVAYVVKVDTSEALVREAHLLRRMRTDPALPAATRAAFPRVFAIDDTPPLFGYLMELVEDAEPLHLAVRRADPLAATLVSGLWKQVLRPAYEATKNARWAHNLHEDYFVRARVRLEAAARHGLLPSAEAPVRVDDGHAALELRGGWGPLLESAEEQLHLVKPTFGTWVHGDPNPENALWAKRSDGSIEYRMLDPKDWWMGDYLFDVAKIGHYVTVTAPVEAGVVAGSWSLSDRGASVSFDRSQLAPWAGIEQALLEQTSSFATAEGDPAWERRYALASAANLLSIAGPRAERAASTGADAQAQLAWIALAVGLQALAQAGCG